MASTALDERRGNDWKTQPRDKSTGQFQARRRDQPRRESIKIRLTASERRQIEAAADREGVSLTRWLVEAAKARAEAETGGATPMNALELLERLSGRRR